MKGQTGSWDDAIGGEGQEGGGEADTEQEGKQEQRAARRDARRHTPPPDAPTLHARHGGGGKRMGSGVGGVDCGAGEQVGGAALEVGLGHAAQIRVDEQLHLFSRGINTP